MEDYYINGTGNATDFLPIFSDGPENQGGDGPSGGVDPVGISLLIIIPGIIVGLFLFIYYKKPELYAKIERGSSKAGRRIKAAGIVAGEKIKIVGATAGGKLKEFGKATGKKLKELGTKAGTKKKSTVAEKDKPVPRKQSMSKKKEPSKKYKPAEQVVEPEPETQGKPLVDATEEAELETEDLVKKSNRESASTKQEEKPESKPVEQNITKPDVKPEKGGTIAKNEQPPTKEDATGQDVDEEKLQEMFNAETGKNAVWRGKVTKGYLEWKEKYLAGKNQ